MNGLLDADTALYNQTGFPVGFNLALASTLNGELAKAYPNIGSAEKSDSQRDPEVVEEFAKTEVVNAKSPWAIKVDSWKIPTVTFSDVTIRTKKGRTITMDPNFPTSPFYRAVECEDAEDCELIQEFAEELNLGFFLDNLTLHVSNAKSVSLGMPPNHNLLQALELVNGKAPVPVVLTRQSVQRPQEQECAAPIAAIQLPESWTNLVTHPSFDNFTEFSSDRAVAALSASRAYKNCALNGSKKHKATKEFMTAVNELNGATWAQVLDCLSTTAGTDIENLRAMKLFMNTKSMLICDNGKVTYRYGDLS